MHKALRDRNLPGGLLRLFFRFPILLYKCGLGFLLGRRFLMLTHTGRASGKKRRVVLEVVGHEPDTGIYYVGSGWGEKANWLLNIERNPRVEVNVSVASFKAEALRLGRNEAASVIYDYALSHPRAFKILAGKLITGDNLDVSQESAMVLAGRLPVVALKPLDREV